MGTHFWGTHNTKHSISNSSFDELINIAINSIG